jgi:ABC-2 type transport system permease protein
MTTATTRSPATTDAFIQLYRLFLRGQLTRLRAFGLLTLGAISILLTAVARTSDDVTDTATTVLAEYGLGIVAPICTLWVATSLLGDLIEDRLMAYLWLKPLPRWVMPTAAVAAVLTVMVPVVVIPLTIAAIVSGVGALIGPTVLASVLAVAAYGGLFVAFGALFNRALWWGLLYILVWENAIARIADGTATLAVRSYVVSILSRATDVDLPLANRSAVASVIVPIGIAVAGTALATVFLRRRDID